MSLSRQSVFLVAVLASFFVTNIHLVEGLRCWECDQYDQVDFQCSKIKSGKSVDCPGPNATCELIQENYVGDSTLKGHYYVLRKCGQQPNFEANSGTCDPAETIGSTVITRCYCNHQNDCNVRQIAGVGRIYTPPQKSSKGWVSKQLQKVSQSLQGMEGRRFSG
ncbi:unnamed protein product [Orchesella dallaii]|uniref:Protein quiver n=1 Tax=Orchesella dallaii TaxID=48710 RepID=A0ABP1PV78_9HEXA